MESARERELQERWGLSPRQASIALALCDGKSYKEIAEELEISFHTVNTHVKAVLAKSGAKSSRRLAALLHSRSEPETASSITKIRE